MGERVHDPRLSCVEQACLRWLVRVADAADQPCARETLERLILRGLVEDRIVQALPVNPPRHRYRATRRGIALLGED